MKQLSTIFFLLLSISLAAQEPMRVTRSNTLARNAPIHNIYVDANNNKWVGSSLGAFQIHTIDYATEVELEEGQGTLLRYPGGNSNLLLDIDGIFNQMIEKTDGLFEGEEDISGAFYDDVQKELWIGTKGIGVFRFKIGETATLMKQIHMGNSKLKTDMITVMFSDRPNSYWIGTEEGVLHNKGGKWKLYESDTYIEAINVSGSGVWVFGEGYLWKVASDKWEEVILEESLSEGDIKGIAFDSKERMWIASEVITRYNPELESVETFGAAEYFTSDFPSALAVDQDDAIWVGTEDKGLYLIEKATAMSISCVLDKAPACDGNSNATLKVVISGGFEPYAYKWSAGLEGEKPANVKPGSYQVTVTDSRGKSKASEITVNDPTISLEVVQGQSESAPNAKDGVAIVKEVSGGQGEYTFAWDNGETGQRAEGLGNGQHSLTVTDRGGCTSTATVMISQESAPLSVAIEQTQTISCNGGATAALSTQINGGKGPFQYAWNATDLSGESPQGIAAGDYELTITDAEGKQATTKFLIEEPKILTGQITVSSPASTGNEDGKATAKGNGGTTPYTFQWDNTESAATATKLAPGIRTVTITDGGGCTTTATVEIVEKILPLNVAIEQTQEIKCNGAASATLTTQVGGGKGPFQYAWSGSELNGESPTNISAGNYELTITDTEGNEAKATISISEPQALNTQITVDAPASTGNADGKATVKVDGGTAPYTFQWDNSESSETAIKLAPGTRTVTVTDAAGCTNTATIEISENILPLSVVIEQAQEIKCNGATSAALTTKVKGGKGPFQYAWNVADLNGENPENLAAGTYELTITDVEGKEATANIAIVEPQALSAQITIDAPASTGNVDGKATAKITGGTAPYTFQWDNSESTETATKLGPGIRTVTVTDAGGCTNIARAEISENILPLNVAIEQTQEIKCNGATSAALATEVKGGKGPFQYAWSAADLNGENPENLTAGTYALTITDAEGTQATANISIVEPQNLSAQITVDAPASTGNADGKATAKVTGGTAPYTFQWDNSENAETATKLGPGTRTITVTDARGCTSTATIEISENILPLSVAIEKTEEVKCNGTASATLAVQVKGGKGPFQYAWNGADLSGDNPKGLAAGDYELTLTDAEGTTAIAKVSLAEPPVLEVELIDSQRSSDEESKDGSAQVAVKGGTPPFTIKWDNGEAGEIAKELGIGNHKATITDANGCSSEVSFETKKRILPKLTFSQIRTGQKIRMEQLFFEADSFRITPVSIPVLDELHEFMIENKSVVIEVGGHTNDIPEAAFCNYLSTARAKSVADYIIQKGIDPKRILHKGYGKRKPLTTNRTVEGRARNQRVEVKILSL